MKRLIHLSLLLLIPIALSGQITPVPDQYILNPLIINPSCAGNRGALDIAAFYRKQWVGITGAPETMTLAIDAPFMDKKLGLGLILVNDKIGVAKETQIGFNYSYKIKMNNSSLSFGLGAGIITTNTKWSDLVVLDPGDENYLSNSKVFVLPDFKFGVYYSNRNFFGALSIPKLLGYQFNYDKNKYTLKFNPGEYYYLINTGYVINISSKTKFFPSTLITFSPGEKLVFDVNAHFSLFERLWLGASYRSTNAIVGLLQFSISNQIKIAYSCDFDLNQLGSYSNGSHEIMIRYEFHYKVNVVTPLVF